MGASTTSTTYDPVLAQQTLIVDGAPLANASGLTVYAEAQYNETHPLGAAYQSVGSCTTDGDGHPLCSVNLSGIDTDASYVQPGVVTLDVWYPGASGPRFGLRAREYVQSGTDNTLLGQVLTGSNNSAVADATVTIRAEPLNSGGVSPQDYPEVGAGATSASGAVQAALSFSNLLNDHAYVSNDSLTLDIDYELADGTWTVGNRVGFSFSPRREPVMALQAVQDDSGNSAAEGTPLLARLEPVDPSTYSGADPLLGVGAVDGSGHALLTPDLTSYAGAPTFETSNDFMIVDLYREEAAGTWALSARVPHYLGATNDPVLAQNQLQIGGQPSSHQLVIIRAIPTDAANWPAGKTYPAVGVGSTDEQGTIHAGVNLALLLGNPTFEDASGTFQLGVYYRDDTGALHLGATIDEQVTPSGDPIVVPSLAAGANPSASRPRVVLKAEPLAAPASGAKAPIGTGQVIGRGRLGRGGHVQVRLHLRKILRSRRYVTRTGVVGNVDVFSASHSGRLGYRTTAAEYAGPRPLAVLGATAGRWSSRTVARRSGVRLATYCCNLHSANIVDTTNTAWGAGLGACFYDTNVDYQYEDTVSSQGGNRSCATRNTYSGEYDEVDSQPYPNGTLPKLDPGSGQADTATINLGWSQLEPGQTQPPNPSWGKVDDEVESAVDGAWEWHCYQPGLEAAYSVRITPAAPRSVVNTPVRGQPMETSAITPTLRARSGTTLRSRLRPAAVRIASN